MILLLIRHFLNTVLTEFFTPFLWRNALSLEKRIMQTKQSNDPNICHFGQRTSGSCFVGIGSPVMSFPCLPSQDVLRCGRNIRERKRSTIMSSETSEILTFLHQMVTSLSSQSLCLCLLCDTSRQDIQYNLI